MEEEGRLQKLLMSGEYTELEDNVLVEGIFIELDKRGDPLRQVLLGLTRDSFLVAKEVVTDYRRFPSVKYDADVDLDINDLEMDWIIPLCYIEISRVPNERVLNILSQNGRHRYYMLSNIGGNMKKIWHTWMDRVKYIHDDPYGYVKQLYNQWNDTFDLFDVKDAKKTNGSSTAMSGGKHGRRRTRAKSIIPENWHDILGIKTSSRDLEESKSSSSTLGDRDSATKTNHGKDGKTRKKKRKVLRFKTPPKVKNCGCFGL
ncbi:uncharacterized protein [Argopecten irradians]|uniref:uncharacterized protein n=1 Tax=Argopecten irradians TaxID=31199 RepID=UPI003714A681